MKKRTGEDRIVTLPNILSFVRILMLPFIILSFIWQEYLFAAIFIILSGATDLLDGYAARTFNDTTKIGKMLDPVADKLTQIILLFGLLLRFPLVSAIIVIFVLKEASMALFNMYFMSKGHEYEGAIMYGKISTTVFYVSMILIFLFRNISEELTIFLLLLTTVFLLISWIGHMIEYSKQYKEYKNKGELWLKQ